MIERLENYFYHNSSILVGVFLLQVNGTATKATCVNDLVYFERYRDDCFLICKGSMEKLKWFYNFLNSLNPNLKFTMDVDVKSFCFLDLKISMVNGQLDTTFYSKPTYSNLYVHAKFCHKPSSIRGIWNSAALPLRRI